MASSSFATKPFKVVPPMKGSFPLDHENACRLQMVKYMKCLKDSDYKTEKCRVEVKRYLECRMENNLMAEESFENLGLKDVADDEENSSSS